MNKREASQYLGKTERAVERYTQAGELSVKYKPGKTRPIADYDETELRELKHRLANPSDVRPAVVSENPTKAEQPRTTPTEALQRAGSVEGMQAFALMVANALRATQDGRNDTLHVELKDKLTLSLNEASQLSGLSRGHLRQAIEAKKLKARIIGKGWRVKRSDLDAYVQKL